MRLSAKAQLSAIRAFVRTYVDSGASQYAGMLAFSLFVALLPLLLGVLTLWGLVASSTSRFATGKELLVDIFPADAQDMVRPMVVSAGEHAGAVSGCPCSASCGSAPVFSRARASP